MLRTSRFGPLIRIELLPTLLGRPVYSVSAYLLGDTLIDSGCRKTAVELAEWCRGRPISRIVHTHHHEDHSGGDRILVDRYGLEVSAPARSVPILERFYPLPLYRRVVWGQPGDVRARALGEAVEIGGAEFRVIPTPGHAADHVCLFDPVRRWVFTGDLFISPSVVYLRRVEDAWRHLESLRTVQELEPRVLICSHAGVVEDASAALTRRMKHWQSVAERAEELVRAGHRPRRVTRELLGREGWMTWISGGEFSKINLIRSLLRRKGPGPCGTFGKGDGDAVVRSSRG